MNKALKYIIGISLIILIFVIAWIGFKIWVPIILGQLPSLAVFPPLLLFGYAIFAGLITFAAPCAIGIVPAYITYVLDETKEIKNKFLHGMRAGLWAGTGPVIVYALVGFLLWGFPQLYKSQQNWVLDKGRTIYYLVR